MKARKIYESPDTIALPDLRYNSHGEDQDSNRWAPAFGDAHSYPFWYETDEFVLGNEHGGHPTNIRNYKESYSGRVWAERKMISFWIYPSEFQFKDIAKELSERLSKKGYEADILNDPEWKVEILPGGTWRGHEDPFTSELISASEYRGSEQRSAKDLSQDHIKTPMDPTKKSPTKYIKRKTVWDRMKESKLVPESLEQLFEFERHGNAKKAMSIGREAKKEEIKREIGWEISDTYHGKDFLGFSTHALEDYLETSEDWENEIIKELLIEFLSGKKGWRKNKRNIADILDKFDLLWNPEYMYPTPSTAEGIIYGHLIDGEEKLYEFAKKYWKPNQIYSLGVNYENAEFMKEGIKRGATNLDIGGTDVFEIPLKTDDGELLQLLLNNSSTDPGELFTVTTGDYYGRSDRTERDESNKALRMAARYGKINTFKVLFNDSRSDPSATNNFALKWAIKEGHDEIVDILLSDERVQDKLHLLPKNIQKKLRDWDLMESVQFERGRDAKRAMRIGFDPDIIEFLEWVKSNYQLDKSSDEYLGYINLSYDLFRFGKPREIFEKFVEDWKRYLPMMKDMGLYMDEIPDIEETKILFEPSDNVLESVQFERGKTPGESMGIGKHSEDLKVYRCGYCGQPTDEYGTPIPFESDEFKRVTGIIDDMDDTTTDLTHGECCDEARAREEDEKAEYEAEAQEELRRQEDDYNDDGYY